MVRTPNGAGELKCHDVNARNLVLRINQKQYAFPEGTQRESAQRSVGISFKSRVGATDRGAG